MLVLEVAGVSSFWHVLVEVTAIGCEGDAAAAAKELVEAPGCPGQDGEKVGGHRNKSQANADEAATACEHFLSSPNPLCCDSIGHAPVGGQ